MEIVANNGHGTPGVKFGPASRKFKVRKRCIEAVSIYSYVIHKG